jgi:hypothetical protein
MAVPYRTRLTSVNVGGSETARMWNRIHFQDGVYFKAWDPGGDLLFLFFISKLSLYNSCLPLLSRFIFAPSLYMLLVVCMVNTVDP